MKILLTADPIGGVWTYALELTRALGAYGVEVAIATMGAPLSLEQWQAVKQIPWLTVFESQFKLEWMDDPWSDVQQAGDWLLQLEQQWQPDVIHLNGYVHAALPWRSPVLVVAHSCVLSWWQAVKAEAAPAEWQAYQHAVAEGLRAADRIIAPSQAMLTALHQHYGPLPNGDVILNGRDPARFRPGRKANFILSVGRLWDEAKNVQALAQIAAELDAPVYVAGETQHPQGQTLQYAGVRSLGRLSEADLAPWLAQAAIYALPARYEPFGLSVLEAALSGCALVLGDIPSLREMWGDTALFVPPDDPASLRDTLNQLIADPEMRSSLATQARTHALELTPQRMATAYWATYKSLVDSPRLPSLRTPETASSNPTHTLPLARN